MPDPSTGVPAVICGVIFHPSEHFTDTWVADGESPIASLTIRRVSEGEWGATFHAMYPVAPGLHVTQWVVEAPGRTAECALGALRHRIAQQAGDMRLAAITSARHEDRMVHAWEHDVALAALHVLKGAGCDAPTSVGSRGHD